MDNTLASDAVIENTALNTVMCNDENWRFRSICQSTFDLIPGSWKNVAPIILCLCTTPDFMTHCELRVTQDDCTTAFVDDPKYRLERRLTRVVVSTKSTGADANGHQQSLELRVGVFECWFDPSLVY